MKLHNGIVSMTGAAALLFLLSATVFSQEVKELTVGGGLLYTAWRESDPSITCGLTVTTPSAAPRDRYPLQVLVVIDASRAMEGAAMQYAKTSAKNCVDILLDKDMFGLITYSKYIQLAAPLQPLNPNNRRNAIAAAGRIKYEEGRNLSDALKKCAEQFSKYKGQNTAGRHILLFTNGEPNLGVIGLGELQALALDLAKQNDVRISTFGYDRFYNEDFLIACAGQTGGRAYFIEEQKIADMPYFVNKEIQRIMNTFAQNVTLDLTIPSGSTIENVYGGTVTGSKIVVGVMQAGIRHPVIFDIKGRPSQRKDLVVNVDYTEPVRMNVRKARVYVDIPLGTGDAAYDGDNAPLLIKFNTWNNVMKTIESIRSRPKDVRTEYAARFKETVKTLDQITVMVRSGDIKKSVEEFWQLQRDIENAAIEEDLLIKRIKYKVLSILYGE